MKIGLAIAPANELPSAFVVFRGNLGVCIRKAAKLGYDDVELALLSADQVDLAGVKGLLREQKLSVPVVSTRQVFADAGLYLNHPDSGYLFECLGIQEPV
jgi:sugar phosphate isomerase/epimerase